MEREVKLELHGLSKKELKLFSEVFGNEKPVSVLTPQTRSANELVSAAFVLGLLQITPALINSLVNLMNNLRTSRHYTFKLTSPDGSKEITGSATPEKIEQLQKYLASSEESQ